MIRNAHFLVFLTSLCLAVIVTEGVVQAEDEDLTSSVYLVFDAETGEFIEVDDADRTLQKHAARDPADSALSSAATNNRSELRRVRLPLGLAVGAILLAAIIAWGRVSKNRSAGSDQQQIE